EGLSGGPPMRTVFYVAEEDPAKAEAIILRRRLRSIWCYSLNAIIAERGGLPRRKAMEWFTQKTPICLRRASPSVSAGSLVKKLTKMDQRVFCRNLLRHILNFVSRVIPSIASRMFDTQERDNKARNVLGVGEPINISAVRRLERDAHARL